MKIRNTEINWIGLKYKWSWFEKTKIEYNYGLISMIVIGPFSITHYGGKAMQDKESFTRLDYDNGVYPVPTKETIEEIEISKDKKNPYWKEIEPDNIFTNDLDEDEEEENYES